jgi:hypothetical protein
MPISLLPLQDGHARGRKSVSSSPGHMTSYGMPEFLQTAVSRMEIGAQALLGATLVKNAMDGDQQLGLLYSRKAHYYRVVDS